MRTPHHRPLQVVAAPPWARRLDPPRTLQNAPAGFDPHVATSVPRAPTGTPTQHRVRSSPTPPRTPHLHPPHTRDEVPRGRRQPASTTASTHGTSWRAVQRRVATALPAPITNTAPHPREARGETSPRPSAAPAPTTASNHRKPTRVRPRPRFADPHHRPSQSFARAPHRPSSQPSECPSRGPTRDPPKPLVETW